jgi:hypothetical protein
VRFGERIIAELMARQTNTTLDGQVNGGIEGRDGMAVEVPPGWSIYRCLRRNEP